jgi:hypothetical protein
MHGAWLLLFVTLWLVAVMLIVLVTGLIRRISALESAGPRDRLRYVAGPRVGYRLDVVDGFERLGAAERTGRGRIVLFHHATQESGDLVREIRRYLDAAPLPTSFDLVLVLDGYLPGVGETAAVEIVVDQGGEIAAAWEIPDMPFLVVMDGQGVVQMATLTSDPLGVVHLMTALATVPAPVVASGG